MLHLGALVGRNIDKNITYLVKWRLFFAENRSNDFMFGRKEVPFVRKTTHIITSIIAREMFGMKIENLVARSSSWEEHMSSYEIFGH